MLNYFLNKNNALKFLAFVVIAFYIFLPIFSLHLVKNMEHVHSPLMADCPYVSGGSAVCPLSLFNHLDIFKNLSFVVLSNIEIFYLISVFVILFVLIAKSPPYLRYFLYQKIYKYKDILILYRNLFSRGILNPKVF